jgi:hypothetical protein
MGTAADIHVFVIDTGVADASGGSNDWSYGDIADGIDPQGGVDVRTIDTGI